jgi:hypothetical protein
MTEPENNSVGDPVRDASEEKDEPSPGPNLVLMYTIIALALIAAIGFAIMIVMPFYLRR